MKLPKLKLVNYGIGNRFKDRIEIHEKIYNNEKYKPLFYEILYHELKHSNDGWSYNDILLDLNSFKNKRLYWNFVLTTPSSWIQFSPIYRSQNKYYIDPSLIIFYLISIALMTILIYGIISRVFN